VVGVTEYSSTIQTIEVTPTGVPVNDTGPEYVKTKTSLKVCYGYLGHWLASLEDTSSLG
jgi:hypothetical protein